MGLNVSSGGVQRGKRSGALGAAERFGMAVLVAGQLNAGLKSLGTVGTCVRALFAVGQQVMIVDRRGLETLAAVLAGVWTHPRVSPHVESQTVGDPKCFATYLKLFVRY